ncbi:MAG: gluconate 2-dehydrogenase subunit 3 family protein [Pricia sp.]
MDRRSALIKAGLLTATAVVMPTMVTLLQSCKNEKQPTWQPEFFIEEEAKTMAALVDTILPRTNTPGALDVNVDVFIDKVIARTYDGQSQENVRSELADFMLNCKKRYGNSFYNLDASEKGEILETAEKNSGKLNPGVWGKTIGEQKPVTFYRSMKSMAIWAYFTSEEIGKHILTYNPVPGAYDGCVPISEIGMRSSL